MEHEPPRPQPAPIAAATPDRAHWTPARQRIFLAALADTGSVRAAAKAVGMHRSSAQRLRQRLAGTPFNRTWAHALRAHAERLADPFGAAPPVPAAAPPTAAPRRASAAFAPRPGRSGAHTSTSSRFESPAAPMPAAMRAVGALA